MRRTDRLFEIIQLFRGGRLLLARDIAQKLEVSQRTIYRDMDTLVASGVPIEGERGVGYILRTPIFLPPLMLNSIELEALHLGMEIVRKSKDEELADAAGQLLIKVDAVLPDQQRQRSHLQGISVFNFESHEQFRHLALLRQAVTQNRILEIEYCRLDEVFSQRRVLPLQVEYWGNTWTCTAWCQKRDNFRVFRVDRIQTCRDTGAVFVSKSGQTYGDYLKRFA